METKITQCRLLRAFTLLLTVVAGCSSNENDGVGDDSDGGIEPTSPMITRTNYESLVAQVFELYSGNNYNKPLLALANDELLDAQIVEQSYDETPVPHILYACEEGSAELDRRFGEGNEGGDFVQLFYRFNDCLDRGVMRRGIVDVYDGRYGKTVQSDALSYYTHPELSASFSGLVDLQKESPNAGALYVWATQGLELVTRTIDGDLALEGMTSRFVALDLTGSPTVGATLEGGFTFRSDATDGRTITVSVTRPFDYSWNLTEPPESSGGQIRREDPDAPWAATDSTTERLNNWYFESGQLELRAEDGSVLLLDADTGVPDTVLVEFDNSVENDSFETSWAPWQPLLRLDSHPSTRVEWVNPESRADPDPLTGPAINAENAHALLDLVIGSFAGEGQREPLVLVMDLMSSLEPLETERDRGVRRDRFACADGGAAQAWRVDEESDAPRNYHLVLTACEWGEFRFDGEVRGEEVRTGGGARSLQTDHLEWLDAQGKVHRFSGSISRGGLDAGASDAAKARCSWSMAGANLVSDEVGAVSVLATDETHFSIGEPGEPAVSFDGTLELVAPATGGHVLRAFASALASDPIAEFFASGGLEISSDDGSALALEVIESVTHIVVRNLDGEVELETPWTTWRDQLSATDTAICEVNASP